MGEHAFGKPARITARTSLGRSGVINIEREAELSGPTHNKGVAILTGYLRSKFAQHVPMVMDASITFEQSYGGVDGDSASSTEIYAVLSSLAKVPLRQDIAVTGSVNQNGEIQPIGGVNLKVEGFFDSCKARGLTGNQGVMIPSTNTAELMLREDVVQAVANGKFHIYAVKTVEQGIEILTGVKAGVAPGKGGFEPGTVFGQAADQLAVYARQWREFERFYSRRSNPPKTPVISQQNQRRQLLSSDNMRKDNVIRPVLIELQRLIDGIGIDDHFPFYFPRL
jgi:predicted ATP-dependent protease